MNEVIWNVHEKIENFFFMYSAARKHIEKIKKIDHKKHSDIGMHCCNNSDKLFNFFIKTFKIFANLAVQIKLYHDLSEKKSLEKEAFEFWKNILQFWDYMSKVEQYANVEKSDFAEKNKQGCKKSKTVDLNEKEAQIAKIKFTGTISSKRF
ncbi:predicted protein [Uncinocarpus reesii 1704]|uniref:Uncharacterized protein n=1 Tax=Uncinocarpus reesii (strain UAMH 1704) TaxID=336963 RepID=C4JLN1_UNCRE|nr:uncharacterized protein UREG_03739 [Uncinocarpus reesii 1704]EEP78893.1 predicted protein [Uncinocarpus reesii 1704]